MKLFFDTRKISKDELTRQLDQADIQAGTTEKTTSWHGEVMEVDWPAANLKKIDAITTTRPSMSITGLQDGKFQAKLAELRQRISNAQDAGIAKIDSVVSDGEKKLQEAAEGAAQKAQSEIDSALHEFGISTNGGPA